MQQYLNRQEQPYEKVFVEILDNLTKTNQISKAAGAAIYEKWEHGGGRGETVQYVDNMYRGLGVNDAVVYNAVNSWIMSAIKVLRDRVYGNQQAPTSPFGYGNTQGYNMNFYGQQASYSNGVIGTNSSPYNYNEAASGYSLDTNADAANQTKKPEQTETVEERKNEVQFVDPVEGEEVDSFYGNSMLDTYIGKIQVTLLRDGFGELIRYVNVLLTVPCMNREDAIIQAKKLFNRPDTVYHMDIQYAKYDRLPVSYKIFNEFVTKCKAYCGSDAAKKQDLRYLTLIKREIESYPRGIANILDAYLCGRFNEIAKNVCIPASAVGRASLSVSSMDALVLLASDDSPSKTAQAWHKIKGFKEQFVEACNIAIRLFFRDVKLFDDTDERAFTSILKANMGFVKTADNELHDIGSYFVKDNNISKYIKATTEERETLSEETKLLSNSVTFLVDHQHVTVTKLRLPGTEGRHNTSRVVCAKTLRLGGNDKDGKPLPSDNLLEYFMRQKTMATNVFANVVLDYDGISMLYTCSRSTDDYLLMTPVN